MDDDNELRRWTTDTHGKRVLVGLNAQETAEYLDYIQRRAAAEESGSLAYKAGQLRWLELHGKHDLARCAVVVAEVELRGNPTIN